MTDPITEESRRVREQIVDRAGGFEGYFDQLEELDRQRLVREATQKKKMQQKPKILSPKRTRKRSA